MKNELLNIDCMDYMKTCKDGQFDLAIVDPPYGIGISGNPVRQQHAKKQWDDNTPMKNTFQNFSEFQNVKLYGAVIILTFLRHNVL